MNPQTPNQNVTQTANYAKFDGLPKPIQERLLERQRGGGEGYAFKTAGISFAPFLVAAAIGWIGLIFYLANDYLWSNFQTIVFGLVSLAAIYLLLYNLHKIIQWLTSRSKCYLLVTPHYIIETRFNDVWFWDLGQLVTADAVHRNQDGRYISTQINLSLERGVTKTFDIKNFEKAEETIEQIYYYKKSFAEATAKNDVAYLDANDDFIELRNHSQPTATIASGRKLKHLLTAAGSILLTVGVMFGAASLNNYYDDKKSWESAEFTNRASSFRTYLKTHPQGRWANDARQKVQGLYDAAEQKYQASLSSGYDQKAADAVLQMLRYAKATQNYRVNVVFERRNEISPNIAEELKEEFEVKNILSLGDTFSDEKMTQRESGLLTVVAEAFRYVIPDDILEFSTDKCEGECIGFAVKYNVGSKDSLYYDLRQEKVPEDERVYYPGIFINWDFGVKIPNQTQNYNFELSSVPAAEITYDSNPNAEAIGGSDFNKVLDADKNYIYDSMVTSAFEDFRANLIYRMGIGTKPKRADEDEANKEPIAQRKRASESNL